MVYGLLPVLSPLAVKHLPPFVCVDKKRQASRKAVARGRQRGSGNAALE